MYCAGVPRGTGRVSRVVIAELVWLFLPGGLHEVFVQHPRYPGGRSSRGKVGRGDHLCWARLAQVGESQAAEIMGQCLARYPRTDNCRRGDLTF